MMGLAVFVSLSVSIMAEKSVNEKFDVNFLSSLS